jgi:hypothetical protein
MKTYKVWVHIDTGLMVTVKAKSEEDACSKAEDLAGDQIYYNDKKTIQQLLTNANIGETEVRPFEQ